MVEDKMELPDWLDDLCVRFILSLPLEELSSAARICFQIEEAQWFYEDFIRPLDPDLPSLNLRHFTAVMFQRCPLFMGYTQEDQERAYQAFLDYKTMVPVRGAIMLNRKMDEVVMVKGWKKNANWSFPRGKIDQNELDLTCALREVYEETGYNLKESGLVRDEAESKSIELQIRGQDLKMYIFRGVPMDTVFVPRTRKEISKVEWHKLADLPILKSKKQQYLENQVPGLAGNANKFYMVAPFLGPLKKWISLQRKHDRLAMPNHARAFANLQAGETDNITSDQETQDETHIDEKADGQHLNRLLHTLRQSSQAVNSDLPEVSIPATQQARYPKEDSDVNSAGLRAVLFGGLPNPNDKPHTPFGQVMQEPNFPQTPSHHHPHQAPPGLNPLSFQINLKPSRYPSRTPIPPTLPFDDYRPTMSELRHRGPSLQSANPADGSLPGLPGESIKEKIFPPFGKSVSTLDEEEEFRSHHKPSIQPSAGAPARPGLDSQRTSLLNLFKSENTDSTSRLDTNTSDISKALGLSESGKLQPPMMFVPTQISQQPPGTKQRERAPTAQQAKLLGMFRTTSSNADSTMLELPQPTAELSASPTGQRSRTNSHANEVNQPPRPVSKGAVLGQIKIQKRPQREEGPVSATVSGPLNIPQFDMIRRASHEKRDRDTNQKPLKVSPIQILSRPNSVHTQVSPPSQVSTTSVEQPSSMHENQRASPMSAVKGVRSPSTVLDPKEAPRKLFQPQILPRPKQSPSTNDKLPAQSSPTLQNNTVSSKTATPANDHQKSLLSLFTRPPAAIPTPSTDSLKPPETSYIVSPLEKSMTTLKGQLNAVDQKGPSPEQSLEAATSMKGVERNVTKPPKKYYAPDKMPQIHTQQKPVFATTNGGTDTHADNRKADIATSNPATSPTSSMTPANQAYLLSFLKGLK